MPVAVVFFRGLFELVGLGGFLVGYFTEIWWLMLVGGCFVVLDDVIEISMGILNPLFPVGLAVVLAVFMTPCFVGVFWASAVFKVLGIPLSLSMIFSPQQVVLQTEMLRLQECQNQGGSTSNKYDDILNTEFEEVNDKDDE